jgi:hypothetical protein
METKAKISECQVHFALAQVGYRGREDLSQFQMFQNLRREALRFRFRNTFIYLLIFQSIFLFIYNLFRQELTVLLRLALNLNSGAQAILLLQFPD